MIITNVKITNFRCYYGTSSITFNSNGKITLIYGDSGYGKSSFLQFFRWMFYSDPDFGKTDDKPLFNVAAYNECKFGECVEVSGQIDFEHLGVNYRLAKKQEWSVSVNMANSSIKNTSYQLYVEGEDGGYHPFSGNVANKINTILPKGLSKYFLLDGERARDIVLDSDELKKAIHALFGLDAYTEAISHIGYKNAKYSVLGQYHTAMAANMTQTVNNMSISEMQEAIQELYEIIESMKAQRKEKMAVIDQKNARRDEIFKTLGAVASKGNIEALIKANNKSIKEKHEQIVAIQHSIGNLFYQNYPYLFLAQNASNSSSALRKKKSEYASNYQNVFENLKKDLLEEIREKNICVCGRELDEEAAKHISGIIDIMPPDSYIYRFGQFVAKAKKMIKDAELKSMSYEGYLSKIATLEDEITHLEDINQEKLDELKRLEDAKDLVEELEQIKKEIEQLNREKAGFEGTIARKKQVYEMSNKQLTAALKNSKVSNEFSGKIAFFDEVLKLLKEEKAIKEVQIKSVLNECVKDIFKKLTTQTELDADKIQFVNDDFSLRTTYLTGGQLAVDVYSYVIGIVKALQACEMENNENPIIIDAPFAFTGNEQSEHLFKTLPSVSKQTILLTLDMNKIKKLLKETDLYDFYVIKNETQEKATLEEGNIDDIKL